MSNLVDWRAQINEGVINLTIGNQEEALTCFEIALASNPSSEEGLYGKAVALGRLGEIENAIQTCKELLGKIPTHQPAKLLLQELSTNQAKRSPQSAEEVEALIDESIELLRAGDTKSALEKISSYSSDVPVLHLEYVRGMCLINLGRLVEASRALNLENKNHPDQDSVLDLLSQVERELAETGQTN